AARRGAPGEEALIPSLALATTGDIDVDNPGASSATLPDGTPGAGLSLSGNTVSVSGTTLRATAGTLKVQAVGDLTVADGAVLATPGYSRVFGDSADPVTVSAPGGILSLVSVSGDIDLADGTTLTVGGGKGRAGTLALHAANGVIHFGALLDADAPDGGGSLVLDEKGAFDLANLPNLVHGQ